MEIHLTTTVQLCHCNFRPSSSASFHWDTITLMIHATWTGMSQILLLRMSNFIFWRFSPHLFQICQVHPLLYTFMHAPPLPYIDTHAAMDLPPEETYRVRKLQSIPPLINLTQLSTFFLKPYASTHKIKIQLRQSRPAVMTQLTLE